MSTSKPKLDDLRIERPNEPKNQPSGWRWPVLFLIVILAVVGIVLWLMRPKTLEVRTVLAREVSSGSTDHTVLNASG
jgi:hypothetical protein